MKSKLGRQKNAQFAKFNNLSFPEMTTYEYKYKYKYKCLHINFMIDETFIKQIRISKIYFGMSLSFFVL